MTDAQTCESCGTALANGGEISFCPQCLAKEAQQSPNKDCGPEATVLSSNSRFEPPSVEALDELLSGFEVCELIGRGGMGAVYRGRQVALDREVAIKILPTEIQSTDHLEERFQREAQTLAKLHHPNIVSIFDFGKVGELFYFVMEYVDGVTLRDTIASGAVSPDEALQMIPLICDALQFAHSRGVVHRDIKPENILVDRDGQLKIADFGLAKLTNQDAETASQMEFTGTQQVMGTAKYMAPEQMTSSKSVDHRADIYSLGVVFYELLTGEAPMGWFQPPSRKVAVDVRLDEVVLRTLESEPDRRYQQASEIKTAIQGLAGELVGDIQTNHSGAEGTTVRLHKLLDVTETKHRKHHSLVTVIGLFVLPLLTFTLYRLASDWAGHAGLALTLATIVYSVRIKRRQIFEAEYKGHTIRLDNSGVLSEKLYLDDGLVRTGGFGTKMEFRFPIKAGEGLGDEIIVWFDAGFTSARCRIEVESKS